VRKKIEKLKKNNKKNQTVNKKLNRLKFWKNRPVWFGFSFISLKLKKSNRTEPNPNGKKTEKNQAKQKKPS